MSTGTLGKNQLVPRLVLFGAVALGVAVGARRLARGCGGFDFERMVERMPENAPPRWMFRNITAIREDTERIVELLERAPAESDRPARTAA